MSWSHPAFQLAMMGYALSFGLFAVSREGAAVSGFTCAYVALVNTLIVGNRFEGKTALFIALVTSGWINIVFLASVAMRWREGNRLPFKILRMTTLLMIPSCWFVFYDERLYPREGHVLWIASMVIALFAESPTSNHARSLRLRAQ